MAKDQFIINFAESSSFCFTGIALNYFATEILSKRNDLKSKQLFFRLFRTGIIGDILYKKGRKYVKSEEHRAENELIAALFESYMFLLRTIYDYLLQFLHEKYSVRENSFYKFIKKIRNGEYPEIKGKLRYYLQSESFEEIRALRDSIKRQTPYIFIYVKDHRYQVEGTIYKRDGQREKFDEKLRVKILGYSAVLFLLMSYMAESITGISLNEQFEISKIKMQRQC